MNLVETILQSTIFISFALSVVVIWSIDLKNITLQILYCTVDNNIVGIAFYGG